jgi:hypothetical protein
VAMMVTRGVEINSGTQMEKIKRSIVQITAKAKKLIIYQLRIGNSNYDPDLCQMCKNNQYMNI